ncbi:MAG: arylsulfatase A-like enzyme, partial [Limisphaerales bacterium]
ELTGSQPIESPDSSSFVRELKSPGSCPEEFDEGYAEYFGARFSHIQRVLWKGDWKFVFNGFDFDELYNLKSDPHEMNNLINAPEHQDLIKELMTRVWAKIRETGDRSIHETHYYPMRFGAVGPNT